jgi:hypothetical protein
MKGNGNFGYWITDNFDLPAYNYTCNQYIEPIAKTPTTYGFSIDHFHQIGNDRITATVHNGGYVQVLESSRGFQWLTYRDEKRKKLGGGIAFFSKENSEELWSDLYDKENSDRKYNYERIFGIGYFQKKIQEQNLEITHNICTPFSDDPVLISEIIISNNSENESIKNVKIIDLWDIYLLHILRSLVVTAKNRKKFGKSKFLNLIGKLIKISQKLTRTDTDGSRQKFDSKFNFNCSYHSESQSIYLKPQYKKNPPNKPDEPSKHNYYPKTIFLSMIQGIATKVSWNSENIINKNNKVKFIWEQSNILEKQIKLKNIKDPCLGIGTEIDLKPNEVQKIVLIFGYSKKDEIPHLIKKYREITSEASILKWNAEKWKHSFIELNCEKDLWLARETKWHSYYTRSSCFFDEYLGLHKFPQGSIYLFGHGLDGAIRDFMLYLNSIIFINPQLAKEYLTYVISFMRPDGKLPYSIYGFAKTYTRSVHSKPSDLYIFLIWGILEYVYTTRDFNFLQEKIPFYPKSTNKESTVLERIYISLDYLFSDKLGIGEHGLIKVGDGDWSDGISLFVENRKKFIQYGESNFNTAFTIYIIQKLIPLLEKYKVNLANQYNEKLISLKQAILQSWNGKWFYRGWDGQANPIGDKSIYLEHHNWILISKMLEKKRAQTLINEIYKNLDNPSPIGQYISYPPNKTTMNILPLGWDVNGGVWHAMNSLLTWAYSLYDGEKAYNSLIKNSLTQRAEAYPHIWYGIWTGSDAYIANYAENAGQAFYHLLTPMCDFPALNLNVHACYLLSVIKIAGIEANYDSLIIHPKIDSQNFQFKSPLISIESSSNIFKIELNLIFSKDLKIKVLRPKWWKDQSIILFNEQDITRDLENTITDDKYISINVKENFKKINIILK